MKMRRICTGGRSVEVTAEIRERTNEHTSLRVTPLRRYGQARRYHHLHDSTILMRVSWFREFGLETSFGVSSFWRKQVGCAVKRPSIPNQAKRVVVDLGIDLVVQTLFR